jgi:hypothetical protein
MQNHEFRVAHTQTLQLMRNNFFASTSLLFYSKHTALTHQVFSIRVVKDSILITFMVIVLHYL